MTVQEFITKNGSHKQAQLDAMELVNCTHCNRSETSEFYQEVLDTADDLLNKEMDKIKASIGVESIDFLRKIHAVVKRHESKYCMSEVYFRHVSELRKILDYIIDDQKQK